MQYLRLMGVAALTLAAESALAQSDVQIFGLLDSMIYRKQLANEEALWRVASGGLNTSFWGIKGREDLGGGVRAEFELTSFFRLNNGASGRTDADPFFSRASWLGLQGRWGGLRAGRQSSLAFINLGRYNALGASTTFNTSLVHNYQSSITQPMMTTSGAADSVWNNTLSYSTPTISGFSGGLYYAPSQGTTAGRRMGASLSYTQRAFSVGLVAEKIKRMDLNFSPPPVNVRINDSELWTLGASYDFKVVKLFGQFVKTKLRNPTTHIDLETRGIGASVPIGGGKLLASYGDSTLSQTARANERRRTAVFAYEYGLSKRTDIYGVLMNDRVTQLSSGNGMAFGIRHRF